MMMTQEQVTKCIDNFKREVDSYCKYKEMLPIIQNNDLLTEAVEEIMHDEYLHARFLRGYLMDRGFYIPSEHADYESKFLKMERE